MRRSVRIALATAALLAVGTTGYYLGQRPAKAQNHAVESVRETKGAPSQFSPKDSCHNCGPERLGGMDWEIYNTKTNEVVDHGTYLLPRTAKNVPCNEAPHLATTKVRALHLHQGEGVRLYTPEVLNARGLSVKPEYLTQRMNQSELEAFTSDVADSRHFITYDAVEHAGGSIDGRMIWRLPALRDHKLNCESYSLDIKIVTDESAPRHTPRHSSPNTPHHAPTGTPRAPVPESPREPYQEPGFHLFSERRDLSLTDIWRRMTTTQETTPSQPAKPSTPISQSDRYFEGGVQLGSYTNTSEYTDAHGRSIDDSFSGRTAGVALGYRSPNTSWDVSKLFAHGTSDADGTYRFVDQLAQAVDNTTLRLKHAFGAVGSWQPGLGFAADRTRIETSDSVQEFNQTNTTLQGTVHLKKGSYADNYTELYGGARQQEIATSRPGLSLFDPLRSSKAHETHGVLGLELARDIAPHTQFRLNAEGARLLRASADDPLEHLDSSTYGTLRPALRFSPYSHSWSVDVGAQLQREMAHFLDGGKGDFSNDRYLVTFTKRF